MALIVVAGNYSFFNVTYLVVCMAMLANSDDSPLSKYSLHLLASKRA